MKPKLKSPVRALLDAIVSTFDGFVALGDKNTRRESCSCDSNRVTRFTVGQLVDGVHGPYLPFLGGRIVQIVQHPTDDPRFGHCAGRSALYVIDLGDATFPAGRPKNDRFSSRYDWELEACK